MLNRKVFSALGGLLAAVPAFAYESSYNLPHGVTQISEEVRGLHMEIFWICVVIAIAVFGVMIYSIMTFRKSKGAVADQTLLATATPVVAAEFGQIADTSWIATAYLLTRRLAPMMVISAVIGAISSLVGLYLSYYLNIVSGSAIVLTATAIFLVVFLLKRGRR